MDLDGARAALQPPRGLLVGQTLIEQQRHFAFPRRQRQLIEMILFKTLASSPQALASTLRTLRGRSEEQLRKLVERERKRKD